MEINYSVVLLERICVIFHHRQSLLTMDSGLVGEQGKGMSIYCRLSTMRMTNVRNLKLKMFWPIVFLDLTFTYQMIYTEMKMYIQHQIQCRNSWYNFIYLACLLWNIFCVHIKHRKNENSIQHHTNIYKQSLALKPQYKDLVSIIGFHSSARHIPGSKKNTLKVIFKIVTSCL